MKTIRREINITPPKCSSIAKYLPDSNYAVFDIETTGLSANFSSIILAGFVLVQNGKTELVQFFAENPLQEIALLTEVSKLLSGISYVITYNGKFFDIPFFKKRCEKYGLATDIPFNLDLYNVFKYYSPIGKILPSLSQKSLEDYAGISSYRSDTISGEESIELYNQYQITRSLELEASILLHNSDDVEQLLRLMTLIKNCDMDKSFSKSGFPIDNASVNKISLKGLELVIEGDLCIPYDYISFPSSDNPLLIRAFSSEGEFEIVASCEKKENAVYFDLLPLIELSSDAAYSELRTNPGFVNNYMVIKENGTINYSSLNALARYLANTGVALINKTQ